MGPQGIRQRTEMEREIRINVMIGMLISLIGITIITIDFLLFMFVNISLGLISWLGFALVFVGLFVVIAAKSKQYNH